MTGGVTQEPARLGGASHWGGCSRGTVGEASTGLQCL